MPASPATPRRLRLVAAVVAVLVALPTVGLALDADDPRRSQLWWFDVLGVEQAWDSSQGEAVVVAVLDTGADLDHPDLVGRFATGDDGAIGRDFVDRDDQPRDPNGHGTIVSGLVVATANNGEGVAGVAPLAKVLPVRVLDADGRGDASTVDAGIRWAVDNGADVINLSLEVEETEGGPDATLTAPNAAIEYAWSNGVVVIAATGNSGAGAAGYPIGSPVVLVGATDMEDELATFSDADRFDAVMAPGVDMVSTWCQPTPAGCNPDARYGIGDGTSFAAPVAAGVVALLLGTGLDHEQAVQVLRDTAVDLGAPGPDERFGVGRIDAAAALRAGNALLASSGGQPDPASEPAASEPPASEQPPSEQPASEQPDADAPGGTPTPQGDGALAPEPTPAPGDDLLLGVPDAGSEAPPPDDDPLAVGADGEPEGPPGALTAVAVALLAVAALGTLREARAVRRER